MYFREGVSIYGDNSQGWSFLKDALFLVWMSYLTNFSFFSDSALELTRVCIKNNKLDAGTKSEYLNILEFAMILNFCVTLLICGK